MFSNSSFLGNVIHTYTHTHTQIYIYVCVYIYNIIFVYIYIYIYITYITKRECSTDRATDRANIFAYVKEKIKTQ